MVQIVIVAHAPLASALKAVVAHTYPERADAVQAIDVQPEWDVRDVEARISEMLGLDAMGGTLLLTDVFGATPFNAAVNVASRLSARVVAGVNVPMVWRVMCYAHEALDALVDRAVDGARQGVLQASIPERQNQNAQLDRATDDQIQRSHQQ